MVVDKVGVSFVAERVAMVGATSIAGQAGAGHIWQITAVNCDSQHSCKEKRPTDKQAHLLFNSTQ
jgi:hypothetical protein